MKKLLTGMLLACMLLGFGSTAFAQTGEVSLEQWFATHAYEIKAGSQTMMDLDAPARLTGLKGEVNVTKQLSIAGSFLFGKSDDFKDEGLALGHAELSNLNIAAQYQVIPMVKVQAGYVSGTWDVVKESKSISKMGLSGITLGAAVDADLGNGIGVFGEALYAPKVNAKPKSSDEKVDDANMLAFEAGAKYDFGQFNVKGGYRYQGFNLTNKGEQGELGLTFSGLFIGAGFSF